MKRTTIFVGLLAGGAVLAGVLAYVLADGGGGGSGGPIGKSGPRKKGAPAAWLGGSAFDGPAGGPDGRAALTAEQERKIRSALEKLGNETAIRTAFTAGVAEPWPLADAQKQFEECVTVVDRGLPEGSTLIPADVCACAIRAIQGVYPREPPDITKSKLRRMAGENMRTAVDECMNP